MTTYTIYANTTDKLVYCTSTAYATARAGTGTLTADTSGTTALAGQAFGSPTYYCYQYFAEFDLTTVPSPSITTTFGFTLAGTPAASKNYRVSQRSWASGTASFVAGASLSGLSAFDTGATAISTSGAKSISGPSDVGSRPSSFGIILYGDDQRNNVTPTGDESMTIRTSEYTGTASDPKLTIVTGTAYTLAMGTGAFTLSGETVALRCTRFMAAASDAFLVAGQTAMLSFGTVMRAATAAFALTGIAALMGIRRFPPVERIINFGQSQLDTNRTLEL